MVKKVLMLQKELGRLKTIAASAWIMMSPSGQTETFQTRTW